MSFLISLALLVCFQFCYPHKANNSSSNEIPLKREVIILLLSLCFFVLILNGSIYVVLYFCLGVYSLQREFINRNLAIIFGLIPLLFYRIYPYLYTTLSQNGIDIGFITTNRDVKYALAPVGLAFITLAFIDICKNSNTSERFIPKLIFLFYPPKVLGPLDNWKSFKRQNFYRLTLNEMVLINMGLSTVFSGARLALTFYLQKSLLHFLDVYGKDSMPICFIPIIGFLQMCIVYNSIQAVTELAQCIANLGSIKLQDNFKKIFSSKYISEFWQRWHINTTNFFGKNVYRPAIKKGFSKNQSTIIVFLLFGLWHGAYSEVILFGLITGFLIICEKLIDPKPSAIRTFLIVSTVFSLAVPSGLFNKLSYAALFNFKASPIISLSILVAFQFFIFIILGYKSESRIDYILRHVMKLPNFERLCFGASLISLSYLASSYLLASGSLDARRVGYGLI